MKCSGGGDANLNAIGEALSGTNELGHGDKKGK